MDRVTELLQQSVIHVDPRSFMIVGLGPEGRELATSLAGEAGVVSLVFLPGEVTLVLEINLWHEISHRAPYAKWEQGYQLLTLDITLPWDVVGYLARITEALAAQGISVGVISSHASDHLLIKENNMVSALKVLKKLGCQV